MLRMLRFKNPVSFYTGDKKFYPSPEDGIKAPVAIEGDYAIQFLNQALDCNIVLRLKVEMHCGKFKNIDKNIEAVQCTCQKAIRYLKGLQD